VGEGEIVHGGMDEFEVRSHGLDPVQLLDLSANFAPVPPPPLVLDALRRASVSSYPDPAYRSYAAP